MGRRVVLLRPRRRYFAEAAFCFGAAIASAFVWFNGLPLGITDGPIDDSPVHFLYAALPLGLFFGIRQARRARGSPGVIIRPEGLQIGKTAMLPWQAVREVRVQDEKSKGNDRVGVVVIELDRAMAQAVGVQQTTHPVDVSEHDTTIAWILASLKENVSEAGVSLPGLDKLAG